jgi:DNA-directed RNA polymerase II subunit RPB1
MKRMKAKRIKRLLKLFSPTIFSQYIQKMDLQKQPTGLGIGGRRLGGKNAARQPRLAVAPPQAPIGNPIRSPLPTPTTLIPIGKIKAGVTMGTPTINITNTVTREEKKRIMEQGRQLIENVPQLIIEYNQLALFSYDELKKNGIEITNASDRGPGSVNDPLMGVTENNQICGTCQADIKMCPGHFGYIELAEPIYHPSYIRTIIQVLNCVCNSCGNLLVNETQLKDFGIDRSHGNLRRKRLEKLCENLPRDIAICQQGKAEHPCGTRPCVPNPKFITSKVKETRQICYAIKGKRGGKDGNEVKMDVRKVYEILDCISDADAKLLGFENGSHPRRMILQALPVIPPAARPENKVDGIARTNGITELYIKIIKENNALKNPHIEKEDYDQGKERLCRYIEALIDNSDGKYSPGKHKQFDSIKEMIQGKEALIRRLLMGKRVNFTARTVLGVDPTLRFGQRRVPKLMISTLTQREKINSINREHFQLLLNPPDPNEKPRITNVIPGSGKLKGETLSVNDKIRFSYRLNIGDEVDRFLQNGDFILFNRQPTLHKQSAMGYEVVIGDEKTFGLNPSDTTPHNADFDGDEGNIHAFQSWDAFVEAATIANVKECIMNAQTSRPIISAVYDTLAAAFLMTQELTGEEVEIDEADVDDYIGLLTTTDQLSTYVNRLQKHQMNPYTGRAIFSALFPADFTYRKGDVIIKDGILIKGTISKDTIGGTSNSIIQAIWKEYGKYRASDFITDVQFLTNEWYVLQGFSVGLDNCMPNDPDIKRLVDEEIAKAKMAIEALGAPPEDPLEHEQYERQVIAHVKSVKSVGDRIIKDLLSTLPEIEKSIAEEEEKLAEAKTADQRKRSTDRLKRLRDQRVKAQKNPTINPFRVMAKSGAKGDEFNLAQIMALLGQQFLKGERMKPTLSNETRALPYFAKNSLEIEARGFITHSFVQGLTLAELIFMQVAGRENLMDTAIKTAETGSMHHKIVKALEDVVVAEDGSVRNGFGIVFQYTYGEDGFDAAYLQDTKTKTGTVKSFINLNSAAGRINARYGF